MKENNLVRILVPVIAVIVVWESIMLVNVLQKTKAQETKTGPTPVASSSSTPKVEKLMAFDLVFGAENKEMKVGKSYPMEVTLVGKNNYSVDSIALYVKYNPLGFEVSGLSGGEKLPKPTFSKVSALKGVAVINYLISDSKGYEVKKDDVVSILKFNVRPLRVGSFDFEIATGNDDKNSVTMFVENSTSGVLPFSSNKLNINVTK